MNYQRRLKEAENRLRAKGIACASLHGDMNKEQRATSLLRFRLGKTQVLIVNEMGARGLDVTECDAVFNLELPSDARHYVHRAGRAGRAGRPGLVVNIVDPS